MIKKVIEMLTIVNYLTVSMAQPNGVVGGSIDSSGCMIGAGYSWCEETRSCIRMWETPCSDNYNDCHDCLNRQRAGENIACPTECSYPHQPVDPIVDPVPVPYIGPVDSGPCPEVMCMMYCENGFIRDKRGCNMCTCSNVLPSITDGPSIIEEPVSDTSCHITPMPCDSQYVCPRITEITNCGEGGVSGYTTYQLSLVVQSSVVDNIYAIYGDDDNIMTIPRAYQGTGIFNSNIGGISPQLIIYSPDSAYDSWLTIFNTDGDIDHKLSSVGIDFDSWTEDQGIMVSNGAIFEVSPSSVPTESEYVIGQLTILEDSELIINVQGRLVVESGENSESWSQSGIVFSLPFQSSSIIPDNCISWYDGCNTCQVNKGIIGACTRLMCFREDSSRCLILGDTISGH